MSESHKMSSKWIRRSLGSIAALALFGGTGAGCLSRPVATYTVDTKTNFTAEVRQQAVDKVDLLFAIDNSRSMADKQDLLAQAVPDLMARLVTPNCVDDNGNPNGTTTSDGTCAQGKAEFQPVHDMHVGIVSSSLGGRGSDACSPDEKDPQNVIHNDDQGHLLVRKADESKVNDADGNGGFLAWFPSTPKNAGHDTPKTPIGQANTLDSDFADMVRGVKEFGCGFEAQLESWYRFLVQPDPYASIERAANAAKASLNGVDATVIQQRHDFLRPDSLVAIIMLTDENDSTVDPLSVGGQGWAYENSTFPGSKTGGGAARGTSACDQPVTGPNTGPNDPACTSCGFGTAASDPNCQKNSGYYDLNTEDSLNERFFHMKQRFGVDPQFPVQRYVAALQSPKVPDRNGEHPNGSSNYVGQANCSNPLFATNLPQGGDVNDGDKLCNLAKGPRTKDLIYFAVIGGVPWQLLLEDPNNPNTSAFKASITGNDWVKILGNDPLNYDFGGADPHMLESLTPRAGLASPTSSDTADALNGREWDTNNADLQYACTFQLPKSRDCSDPKFTSACDCNAGRKVNPPLCNSATGSTQVRGKAYPTIREFSVVRAIGDQGIIASLCPRTLDTSSADYGYRPAVRVIVDRLKNALANQCLPQALTADTNGQVPCLILLTLEDQPGGEERCDPNQGLSVPDPAILAKFREQAEAEFKANGGDAAGLKDPKDYAVCQLQQLVVPAGDSCADQPDSGWCYVQNGGGKTPAGGCPQAILFTASGNKVGAKISLQCIEKSSAVDTSQADGG